MTIFGWKNIAKTIGIGERTIKDWHYKYCKLPIQKVSPIPQSDVFIDINILMCWLEKICEIRSQINKKFKPARYNQYLKNIKK